MADLVRVRFYLQVDLRRPGGLVASDLPLSEPQESILEFELATKASHSPHVSALSRSSRGLS